MKAICVVADRILRDETPRPGSGPGAGRPRRAATSGRSSSDDRGHGGAGPPIVLFLYAPGRGREHPLRFLAGYRGRPFLQCDAYQSYSALTEITRDEGPWHAGLLLDPCSRPPLRQAGVESEGSPIAEEMLRQIALLYQMEKTVRGQAPRTASRPARTCRSNPSPRSAPGWKPSSRASRRNPCLPKISAYTLAPWSGLVRFLDDGTLGLDTNPVENQIRPDMP